MGTRRRGQAVAAAEPAGHRRGLRGAERPGARSGPIAETFPEPLAPLEVDLRVPPLRETLLLTGARAAAEIDHSPVVAVVDGRVALDLELIAEERPRRAFWGRLDPRPAAAGGMAGRQAAYRARRGPTAGRGTAAGAVSAL